MRYGVCWLETSTNFLSAFMVCLNSSANLMCSWSCQVSPSAANRACNDTSLSFRSVLNRLSSSAKRRTCSGSMIAWAIVSLSVCFCGSPGRPVFQPGGPALLKAALFHPARQILTTPACYGALSPSLWVALGWPWGGLRVALGFLSLGYQHALGWLAGGLGWL